MPSSTAPSDGVPKRYRFSKTGPERVATGETYLKLPAAALPIGEPPQPTAAEVRRLWALRGLVAWLTSVGAY